MGLCDNGQSGRGVQLTDSGSGFRFPGLAGEVDDGTSGGECGGDIYQRSSPRRSDNWEEDGKRGEDRKKNVTLN